LPHPRQVVSLRLDPKLRARADAADVVQETQLEAVRRWTDYLERRPMPFRRWLRKTAYERLLMIERHHVDAQRRAVGREVALPDRSSLQLFGQLLAAGSTPSQQLSRAELARRVRQAVARLAGWPLANQRLRPPGNSRTTPPVTGQTRSRLSKLQPARWRRIGQFASTV